MRTRINYFMLFVISFEDSAQLNLKFIESPTSLQIFAIAIISTGVHERDFEFSPDGTEMMCTLQLPQGIFQTILYSKKDKQRKWSKLKMMPFAASYDKNRVIKTNS